VVVGWGGGWRMELDFVVDFFLIDVLWVSCFVLFVISGMGN
jgi:hypothetical protein